MFYPYLDSQLKRSFEMDVLATNRFILDRYKNDATFERFNNVSEILEVIFESMSMIVIQYYNNKKIG